MGVRLGGGWIEQKGKGTHGKQCGDCCGEGGRRRLNGNGKKNTIKLKKIPSCQIPNCTFCKTIIEDSANSLMSFK